MNSITFSFMKKILVINLGRVISKNKITDTETTYKLEGDVDYSSEYVIGNTANTKVYGSLGSILSVLESRWVFLVFIIIPILFIFLFEIYEFVLEVKLFTDKKSQLKFQKNSKDIKFNLQENKIENIILINPIIFLNNNDQKEKIKNIFDTLNNNKINFLICVFSFNELEIGRAHV